MTPKELVQRSVDKARADIRYDFEQLELWYDLPQTNVDDRLIDSFEESCLNHLTRLITLHCKDRCGADISTRMANSGEYQIGCLPIGYVIFIDGKNSSTISFLPKNIQEILDEYCNMRKNFRDIVEDEFRGFRADITAGLIAEKSIEFIAADLLVFYNVTIKVICQEDRGWKCLLSSTMFDASISFFSDADHIREDIERCATKIYELDR
jgi:hypothetical protein